MRFRENGSESLEEVTALIYAGGRASRMGGINKAMLPLFGKPLFEHLIGKLRRMGIGRVVVSANEWADAFRPYGFPVLRDPTDEKPGAVAALDALGRSAIEPTRWVLTLPCDAPFFPEDLPETLRKASDSGAFPLDAAGRPQSAFALIPWKRLPVAQDYVAEGGHRLGECLRRMGLEPLPSRHSEERFANLNTPEDLVWAQAHPELLQEE